MTMTMKAIETRYRGYRFRSRLEARWAVFFDALGIEYQYEPEGFVIQELIESGKPHLYLPDFYLPKTKTWVECKGDSSQMTEDEWQMLAWAIDYGGALPEVQYSVGTTRGLLLLGDIPYVDPTYLTPIHPCLQHHKGAWINWVNFSAHGIEFALDSNDSGMGSYIDASWGSGAKAVADECAPQFRPLFLKSTPIDRRVCDAYQSARSARFEHGETPCHK